VHVKAEGGGRPLAFVVTEGQRHDSPVFEELMEKGKVKRTSAGRPRLRPGRLAADRSYSNRHIRSWLASRKVRAIIPQRRREKRNRHFDGELYKQRNRIERLVARLKQFRRIATRYEKTAESYLAMLTLAALLLWL
jgi:transposase